MNSKTAITTRAPPKAIKLRVNAIPLPIEGIVPLVAKAMAEKINDANPETATIGNTTASMLANRQNFRPDFNDMLNP